MREKVRPHPGPYSCSKVIHRWRGEPPGNHSPQPTVNNFGGKNLGVVHNPCLRFQKKRHAAGMTNHPAHVFETSGETFAPSHVLWIDTNTQRLPLEQTSIRLSIIQIFA